MNQNLKTRPMRHFPSLMAISVPVRNVWRPQIVAVTDPGKRPSCRTILSPYTSPECLTMSLLPRTMPVAVHTPVDLPLGAWDSHVHIVDEVSLMSSRTDRRLPTPLPKTIPIDPDRHLSTACLLSKLSYLHPSAMSCWSQYRSTGPTIPPSLTLFAGLEAGGVAWSLSILTQSRMRNCALCTRLE